MRHLAERTALVTGGTGGIGFHIVAGLVRHGMRVIITGRDRSRGEAAMAELRRKFGSPVVELLLSDASSVAENVALAQAVERRFRRLDVLVNNAGGLFADRRETSEGIEATLALNFVGACVLTTRLLPLLERTRGARIINIVSSAFEMWKDDPFTDVQSRSRYVGIESYGRAKLLNLLFVLALARRVAPGNVSVTAVNPGMAWTPGVAALTPHAVPHWRLVWPVVRWFQRRASPARAAAAPIWLATRPQPPESGRYYDERTQKRLRRALLDVELQNRAWELAKSLAIEVPSRHRARTDPEVTGCPAAASPGAPPSAHRAAR